MRGFHTGTLTSIFKNASKKTRRAATVGLVTLASVFALQCSSVKAVDHARTPTEKIDEPLLNRAPLSSGDIEMCDAPLTVTDSKLTEIDAFLHRRDDMIVKEINYPDASGKERKAYLTLPKGEGPYPLIVVFPALGAGGAISEVLAKGITRKDYATLRMIESPSLINENHKVDDVFNQYRNTVADARALAEYLAHLPEIDDDKSGVAGLSLGALMAATTMGVDEDFDAGSFLLGAGNLPEILWESNQYRIEKFRDDYKADSLHTKEEFIRSITPYAAPLDPLRYAGSIDRDKVMMITGRFDGVMPPKNSKELWKELGEPQWTKMPTGHYPALYIYWMVNKTTDFFDQTFAAMDKAPAAPDSAPRRKALPPVNDAILMSDNKKTGLPAPSLRGPA